MTSTLSPHASLTLDAPGIMACDSLTVRTALARVPGVDAVLVNLALDRVTIQYDATRLESERLVRVLHRLGLKRAAAQAALTLGQRAPSS